MKEVIKVNVIDTEKSSYRIELIKSESGNLYVSMNHAIFSYIHDVEISQILIRPENLDEVIHILVSFQKEIPKQEPKKKTLSKERREEIINRYLNKGLEIETLAVQFNCTVFDIRQLFFEENIAITSNKLSDYKKKQTFWRRRKRKRSE